jgi:flagellar biosynthesis/type III secretory pathway protein FliH
MKDKTPFLISAAFIVGAVLTHLLDTKVHRQEILVLEKNSLDKEIQEHTSGFSKGWEQGAEYGRRQGWLDGIRSEKTATTD